GCLEEELAGQARGRRAEADVEIAGQRPARETLEKPGARRSDDRQVLAAQPSLGGQKVLVLRERYPALTPGRLGDGRRGIVTSREHAVSAYDGEGDPVALSFARVERKAQPAARLVLPVGEAGAFAQQPIDGLSEHLGLRQRQRSDPAGLCGSGE